MKNNLLVCGGLPRSATTFLHAEISNYQNVFSSSIKESYLFEQNDFLIDLKLKTLQNKKICLDFTPEYIFNKTALNKISSRKINCFFILREYHEYRRSLEAYLSINKIENNYLLQMTEADFLSATQFVTDHFLYFKFEDIKENPAAVLLKIQKQFKLDFGEKMSHKINMNASSQREHFALSVLHNYCRSPMKLATSALLGVV